MKRKEIICKVLSVLLMAFMIFTAVSGNGVVLADDPAPAAGAVTDPYDTSQFTKKDESGASQSAQNIIGSLISIIQVIGTGVAIIMLIFIAIKYIAAAPSEKADLKKSITVYVVGAIILFSASALLGIVKTFATSNIT